MADERLRGLERASDGGLADRLRLLRERARAGRLEPPLGRCVGGCWLEAPLGELRWLGLEEEPLAEVELELLPPGLSWARDAVDRLRPLAALPHPHLRALRGAGFDTLEGEEVAWARAERLAGERSLHEVRDAGLDWRRAVELARDAALGLGHLHAHGHVHGRVTPTRIVVTDEGRAVVIGHEELGRWPGLRGNPTYDPPESFAGPPPPAPTAAWDVWGLGASLFLLLAGRPPFRGDTVPLLIRAIVDEEPAPAVRRHAPDVPRAVAAVVARCLEKEPDRRFAAGDELAAALAEAAAAPPRPWWRLF